MDLEPQDNPSSGRDAMAIVDYKKAKEDEIDLEENEYLSNIFETDYRGCWMGTNSRGQRGLFPSHKVVLINSDVRLPKSTAQIRSDRRS